MTVLVDIHNQTPAQKPGEQRSRPAKDRWGHVFSALDLGTNNCRLLVAKPSRNGFKVIDAFSRIVRLGEGVGQSGEISWEAMDRAIAALSVCARKIRRNGVTRSWNIATQACRSARNGDTFVERVHEATGIELEVLLPEKEADLAFTGCTPLLDHESDGAVLFDIGGGSTELMWIRLEDGVPKVVMWTSLPCGVVTLAERFGGIDVTAQTYESMVEEVSQLLAPAVADERLGGGFCGDKVHLLGTSGTVTTIAGVHLELDKYDRNQIDGRWIEVDEVHRVVSRLAEMDYDERAAHPCIGKGRADLVLAGCAIFEAINRAWPCERLRVADRGLREGMLIKLMNTADSEAAKSNAGAPVKNSVKSDGS